MVLEGRFGERMARWRERQARPGATRLVLCTPIEVTEFTEWVFEQEENERIAREERSGGKFQMQVALDRAAAAVSALDAKEWCGCIGYFIEAIDALGTERGVHALDIQAVLTSVHRKVAERVCLGTW